MSKVEGWEKIFPAELCRLDHLVDAVGCFLIEAGPSIGVDELVVWNFLVEGKVELIFEGFGLFLGEIGVNDLRNRHFANTFHEAGSCHIVRRFVGHGGKGGDFGGLVGEHGNELFVPVGRKGAVYVEIGHRIGFFF